MEWFAASGTQEWFGSGGSLPQVARSNEYQQEEWEITPGGDLPTTLPYLQDYNWESPRGIGFAQDSSPVGEDGGKEPAKWEES